MIVPDANLLIYAYESASTDGDFDRFVAVRWINPVETLRTQRNLNPSDSLARFMRGGKRSRSNIAQT
jgi:hypothetical protein